MHLVDPRKTIKAPYSQGDVVVFGQNPGQQCVAMSLCALMYHNMKGIGNPNDLKQIMHIGNQLYSSLSQLSRQSFLLLTDLPSMLTVLEKDYQLEYSESYFQLVMSMVSLPLRDINTVWAWKELLSHWYQNNIGHIF